MTPYIEIKGLFVLFQFTRARFPRSRFSCKSFVKCSMCWYKLERAGSVSEISVFGGMCHMNTSVRSPSLRSKRFRLVSEQKRTFGFDRARNETRTKKWKRGEGEGKEGNACRQTPWFWKPAFASERSAWLARLVEQYWHVSIKGLFHTERSCMVRDTHLNFLRLLFILFGQDLPKERAL